MLGGQTLHDSRAPLLAPACALRSPVLGCVQPAPAGFAPLNRLPAAAACLPTRLQRINDVIVANVGQFPEQMDAVIELVDEVTGQRRVLDSPPVFQPAAPLVNATC